MTRRRIAVIGGGVSGITAGYVLSPTDDVTLFEADSRLGGHADTHLVVPPAGPPIGVDTGFIVYNERTYPLLTQMFAELGVATQASEMSMSVRCVGCGLQYAGQRGPGGVAAGLRRGRGRYLRMLTEIPRFHRAARGLLASSAPDDRTLGQFLQDGGFSGYFTAHFALPLVAAVWSCPPGTALSYPARYLCAFLANHGMLSVSGSPPWRTVTGGSRGYVERAAKRLHDIRLCTPVRAVRRPPDRARLEVRDAADEAHQFDAVVIATHPDQALRLLDPPTQAERDVLGAFGYTRNPAVLHTDVTLLPAHPAIRASWNYELGGCGPDGPAPRISYHMNRLQDLPTGEDYIVTLGGRGAVDPRKIIDTMDYAHPAYTPASVAAQRRLPALNTAVTAFAGAYHGWGFHEDGCRSGAEAAQALGGTW
ncbi:MAG: NAD(P)/FAD-dependent oxidoreductase [Streptosporangiaceae bacterium]